MDKDDRKLLAEGLLNDTQPRGIAELRDDLIKLNSALTDLQFGGRREDLDIAAGALGCMAVLSNEMQRKLWSINKCLEHQRTIRYARRS